MNHNCIDFSAWKVGSNEVIERKVSLPPWSPEGKFFSLNIQLPAFRQACYFAPFQKYAINPALDLWPEGYNQCHPLPVTDFSAVKRGGMFAILELVNGGYMALLPVVTDETMSWMAGTGDGFALQTSHFGNEPLEGEYPLLVVAVEATLLEAVHAAWKKALSLPALTQGACLREEKKYPEIFEYLGWCTWEEYRSKIDEKCILDAIENIDHSELPIRWLLIDEGHIDQGDVENATGFVEMGDPVKMATSQLSSFAAERKKFPNGWKVIQERFSRSSKLKWSGIWLNFNGYWGGIRPDHQLQNLKDCIAEYIPGVAMPVDRQEASDRFYEEWVRTQSDAGFDFIKVDSQARNITMYMGYSANAVRAARINHRALEKAVLRHMQALINCMAHNNICAFSTSFSQVTRCSEDYISENLWRAKHHLHNSFGNMLWMGETVWGDHDMFHSTDKVSGGMMARSKAVSGGLVCLSDQPDKMVADLVWPLCDSQGKVYRALRPGIPVTESVFSNPYEGEEAFQVVAPLENGACAWAAYNLTHPEHAVRAHLLPAHYRFGRQMLLGKSATEGDLLPLLAWDVKRRTALKLGQGYEQEMPIFDDLFYILLPIIKGWGLIGREDKILTSHTFEKAECLPTRASLRLKESGPFVFWKQAKSIQANVGKVVALSEGLWKLELPVSDKPVEVLLTLSE